MLPDESLGEIAIRLYGTTRMAKKIAAWNSLSEPFALKAGQSLVLKKAPSLEYAEADRLLLNMWRAQMKLPPGPTPVESKQEEARVERQETVKQDFLKAQEEAKKIEAQEAPPEVVAEREVAAVAKLTHEKTFAEGEELFKAEKYEDAIEKFRQCRDMNSEIVGPYFYEIRALKILNRGEDARDVARLLVKEYPELVNLPLIRLMLQ